MSWQQYTVAMLISSLVSLLLTYIIERVQSVLPWNPQHLAGVPSSHGLQHRSVVHYQHQLAGLHSRDHDDLFQPDGWFSPITTF